MSRELWVGSRDMRMPNNVDRISLVYYFIFSVILERYWAGRIVVISSEGRRRWGIEPLNCSAIKPVEPSPFFAPSLSRLFSLPKTLIGTRLPVGRQGWHRSASADIHGKTQAFIIKIELWTQNSERPKGIEPLNSAAIEPRTPFCSLTSFRPFAPSLFWTQNTERLRLFKIIIIKKPDH